AFSAERYRNALMILSSFALELPSYAGRGLDLYSTVTGTGSITEQWITDRARMLQWRNVYDQRQQAYGTPLNITLIPGLISLPLPVLGDARFEDRSSAVVFEIDGFNGTQPRSLIIFGSDANENL